VIKKKTLCLSDFYMIDVQSKFNMEIKQQLVYFIEIDINLNKLN